MPCPGCTHFSKMVFGSIIASDPRKAGQAPWVSLTYFHHFRGYLTRVSPACENEQEGLIKWYHVLGVFLISAPQIKTRACGLRSAASSSQLFCLYISFFPFKCLNFRHFRTILDTLFNNWKFTFFQMCNATRTDFFIWAFDNSNIRIMHFFRREASARCGNPDPTTQRIIRRTTERIESGKQLLWFCLPLWCSVQHMR